MASETAHHRDAVGEEWGASSRLLQDGLRRYWVVSRRWRRRCTTGGGRCGV